MEGSRDGGIDDEGRSRKRKCSIVEKTVAGWEKKESNMQHNRVSEKNEMKMKAVFKTDSHLRLKDSQTFTSHVSTRLCVQGIKKVGKEFKKCKLAS